MTLLVTILLYAGTLSLTSGIQGTSLQCTFVWIMNGAPGNAPTCSGSGTGNGNTTGPQFATLTPSTTPPGSVILNGNPFTGL